MAGRGGDFHKKCKIFTVKSLFYGGLRCIFYVKYIDFILCFLPGSEEIMGIKCPALVFAAQFLILILGRAGLYGAVNDAYSPGDFRRISAMTAKILDRNHYSGVKMTPELSGKIFDRYFDMLDPSRMFFTEKDVKTFENYRLTVGGKLQQGDCDFAFELYDLFRKRYREYRDFTKKMLEKPIDFEVEESMNLAPEKYPRPADESAMLDLWRKRIKNDLLLFMLMEKSEAEEKNPPKSAVPKKTPAERILQRQRDFGNDIEKRDPIDVLGLLLDSMAQSYGAHSDYQAPKRSEDFEINMSLSLSGIGATLTSENGYIKIVELVPGGPAALSGKINVNDRIISVIQENGENVDLIDMPVSKAVQYIRGEKGSKVTLNLMPADSSALRQVLLVRDKINLDAGAAKGEVKEVPGKNGRKIKVGVITLPGFYMDFEAAMRGDRNARRASKDVADILDKFSAGSVDSVVIDLRKNGGGSLPDAIILSGLFLPGGPVVQVRGKESLEVEYDRDPRISFSGPVVVLTSKFSASAAEIFTAALRDANRAIVVGDSRTFGKGTVLRVESLDRYNSWFGKQQPAGSVTFEIAQFYRPSGGSVQQLGIVPDIKLPTLTDEMEVGEMFMLNHLPWDSIKSVDNKKWDEKLDGKISALKKLSETRIAGNKEYERFIRQIGIYRKIRERKEISLNLKRRWDDYCKEKQISEEVDKLAGEKSVEKSETTDHVLQEAVCIAADYWQLGEDNK